MQNKGIRRYSANTAWLVVERIFNLFSGLFVGVWVARYLGPDQFGIFSYVQSFVGLFIVIASLGLDGIVIRELVKGNRNKEELLATSFWLKLIGATVVLLMLAVAVQTTSNSSSVNLMIFIVASAAIFQSFGVISLHFDSVVKSKYIVYSKVFALFVSSVIKVLLIINSAPLIAFAWVVLFDSVILALGLIYFYVKRKNSLRPFAFLFDQATVFYLLKRSWPLILSAVMVSIYMKLDQVMIKEILGNEAVGQYAAASKLSEISYFIPAVIVSSLFPAIIITKQNNQALYRLRVQRLLTLMVWGAVAVAFPITLLSDWVVNTVYGQQYNQASVVLTIHIWASVFVFWGMANEKWLLVEELQIYSTLNTAIGAIINIVLNFFLIPEMGISGAAWATLVSYFFSVYICLLFWRKTRASFFNLSRSVLFF